jgi:uncharacterized membrane protein YciS (DUF1049 family)
MIQFNLLPDVKKEYVKAKRTKRLMVTASFFASGIAIAVVLLLFSIVQIAQKKNISDLTKDIKGIENQIQGTKDLNRVLTVQNQLSLLTGLHQKKPMGSRIFDFMPFFTPQNVAVGSLNLDIVLGTLSFEGTADSLATVNKLVDNVKATTYSVDDGSEAPTRLPVFKDIKIDLSGDQKSATYGLKMGIDIALFDSTKTVVLHLVDQQQAYPARGGGDAQ